MTEKNKLNKFNVPEESLEKFRTDLAEYSFILEQQIKKTSNYDLTLEKEVTREFAWEVMASIFQLEDINNKNILLEQLKKSFGKSLRKLPVMTMEEVIDFQKVIKFLNEMLKEI